MENNNILTPNINTNENNETESIINTNENDSNSNNQIKIPDWDLIPPFETVDRSELWHIMN